MKHIVLVIGSGGREAAIVWALSQSPFVKKIYCAPGNAGTAQYATNVNIAADDIEGLLAFAKAHGVHLTIVGPEKALLMGIVNRFQQEGLIIFGPTMEAARLEGSKIFAKYFMTTHGIPTGAFQAFHTHDDAMACARARNGRPCWVKADGNALGKGALFCPDYSSMETTIGDMMLRGKFGDAGKSILVEEPLDGQEVSIQAFTGGTSFRLCPGAQDHKRVGEGDTGENTGGMGTASMPLDDELIQAVRLNVLSKTLNAMNSEGNPFAGFLFPGLMITKDGIKVLEFNARGGDPETQSHMMSLTSDAFVPFMAGATGKLDSTTIEWSDDVIVDIVLASGGYPGKYASGKLITGLDEASRIKGVHLFHAGTELQDEDVYTKGGRVLNVMGRGRTLSEARDRALEAAEIIQFEGKYYRRDIGKKLLATA